MLCDISGIRRRQGKWPKTTKSQAANFLTFPKNTFNGKEKSKIAGKQVGLPFYNARRLAREGKQVSCETTVAIDSKSN